MKDEQFLTTEEVLKYLQVNLRTVYRLIKTGKLPAIRVGRLWRFRRRDIELFLPGRRAGRGQTGGTNDRPHVLVVDDEPTVRDLLSKTLTTANYDVETAPDGPSGLDRLQAAKYDLLITDLKMPGMDGLSVIREVRQKHGDLPVIVITGHSTEASAIEALNLGVSGYLTKPFRMTRVLAVAARALGEPEPAI